MVRKGSIREEMASRVLEDEYIGNQSSKKGAEEAILDGFLRRLGVNIADVEIQRRERPDFIVGIRALSIGIELTRYHFDQRKRGSLHHVLFEDWRRVARKLTTESDSRGRVLESWFGAVHFKAPYDRSLRTLDYSIFTDEVIRLAQQRLTGTQSRAPVLLDDFSASPYLNDVVERISCANTFPETNALWWHASLQVGTVPNPILPILRIIRKKDAAAAGWPKCANQTWLVVFARAAHLSEMGILTGVRNLTPFQALSLKGFDKVFFWDKFTEAIWELWTEPRVILDHDGRTSVVHINRIPDCLRGPGNRYEHPSEGRPSARRGGHSLGS
jgi:hypothetical protein